MGFSVHKNGFVNLVGNPQEGGLGHSLITELTKTGGMQLVFPATVQTDTTVAVLESAAAMDPLADSNQKWRLRIEVETIGEFEALRIHAGTSYQIPEDGSKPSKEAEGSIPGKQGATGNDPFLSGNFIGAEWPTGGTGAPKPTDELPFLFTGLMYQDSDPASGPLSYRLSVSDHGVAFCVWKDAYDDAGDKFAWFVVQRPVDPNTGATLVDGYAPVFAVYSGDGGGHGGEAGADMRKEGIRKFVVRESDVFAPTKSVSAVVASEDSNPIINPMRQVAISVDNKYMITFPAGLNTPKRAYKHELDMLAYTSADVISQDSDVDITVFGEATPRKYKAMNANGPHNTQMRILLLVEGGGIPAAGGTTTP